VTRYPGRGTGRGTLLKICCCCHECLPIDSFYRDRSRPDGHNPRCKKCAGLGVDRDNRRAYEKRYREEHYDRRRAIVRKSMLANQEHHKKVRQAYLKTEKGRQCYRRYTTKRYALRKNAPQISDVNLLAIYNRAGRKCVYCGTPLSFDAVHFDHYIPLSKGGAHVENNLRISCQRCNLSKGDKLPEQWEVYHPLV